MDHAEAHAASSRTPSTVIRSSIRGIVWTDGSTAARLDPTEINAARTTTARDRFLPYRLPWVFTDSSLALFYVRSVQVFLYSEICQVFKPPLMGRHLKGFGRRRFFAVRGAGRRAVDAGGRGAPGPAS
jgi:hypothetical protein